jgi:hypothetical protein
MARTSAWAAPLIALLGAAHGQVVRAQRALPRGPSEDRVVLLIRGTPPDAAGAEVVARIRGELRAARFEVQPAAQPDAGTARQVVEREAQGAGVVAAMGVFFDTGEPEVWVADARSGRTAVEPLVEPAGGERRASALAVKAVDLLRAVLADIPIAQRPEAPRVATVPSRPAGAAPARFVEARAADSIWLAGAGWLRAGGAGTFAPALSVAVARDHLGARLAVSGLGSSMEMTGQGGRAQVAQDLAVFELLACWRPRRSLRACGAAGGGVELLRVAGTGAPGFVGTRSTLWAGAAAAGASLAWTPGRWLAVGVDARAVGSWPSTNVRIDGATVAQVGGPGVWLTAGVGARL